MPLKSFTVTESHAGKRLDLFLQHHFQQVSRNRIQSLLADGLALVNGRQEKPGYKVKAGDRIKNVTDTQVFFSERPKKYCLTGYGVVR